MADIVYVLVGLLVVLIVACGVRDTLALRRRAAVLRREDEAFEAD